MHMLKVMLLGFFLAVAPLAATTVSAAQGEPAIQAVPTVNINQAGEAELSEALQGVGPSKARAIITHREKNGPFKSAEELANVKGIGPATLKRNLDRIRLK